MSGRYHLSDLQEKGTAPLAVVVRGLYPSPLRLVVLASVLVVSVLATEQPVLAGVPNAQLDALLPAALSRAYTQLAINPPDYPIYTNSQGTWVTAGAWYWSSGFWPGELWLARDLSGSSSWTAKAQSWTAGVQSQQYDTTTHDVGFKIFPPFANGYRLTGDAAYRSTILTAAGSMATRYNSLVGCIQSDEPDSAHLGQFPVATDDVPTLEILLWAARSGGQAAWRDMAISHALRTRDVFIRPDGGTYHVVWFDPSTGDVLQRGTMQGYSDESTWTRGQAWAIYGFVLCYRETGDGRFLATARTLADYYLSRLPADQVPPWDFDAGQPSLKDTSAAAIVAAGLLELSGFTADPRYWDAACNMLISLCSSTYLSSGTNSQGILRHGTYNKVTNTGVDASCIWGDYYFLQAIQRYRHLSRQAAGSHTSSTAWQSWPMPVLRGTFRLEYDATPSGASIDGVMALSAGPGTAYNNCAALIRFNPSGYIDVRSGSTYQAAASLRYAAGTSYHFRVDVDVQSRTYSVHVTPSGGSEVQLAGNYAFRTEQAAATYLDTWAIVCQPGSFQVTNLQVQRRVHNQTRDTWHVTVQEAIDAAEEGNQIVLEQGTYTGHGNRDIDFLGKAITVRSTDPADPAVVAATIVDAAGSSTDPHYAFDIQIGEGFGSILSGLTITHGYPAGVRCRGMGELIVDSCRIQENDGDGMICSAGYYDAVTAVRDCAISTNAGCGIRCDGIPGPEIAGCHIMDNSLGGIIASERTSPRIKDCRIEGNQGSGIYLEYESEATITGCRIRGNSTTGNGAGIYIYQGWPEISNCEIAGNHAQQSGGGVWWSDSGMTIVNCTLAANSAQTGGGICGASDIYNDSSAVRNCVLWGNTAVSGSQMALNTSDWAFDLDTLTISHSDVQGGASGVFVAPSFWHLTWGVGNANINPLFADADGPDNNPATWADNDYHLIRTSPCRNTGDLGYVPLPGETDIDGQPRVLYGRVDMGADEFLLAGDIIADGSVNVSDLQALVAAWASGPSYTGLADLNRDGYVNVGDLQIFVASWGASL